METLSHVSQCNKRTFYRLIYLRNNKYKMSPGSKRSKHEAKGAKEAK
jgi:hypothetical protein